ncbi:MAG: DUF6492 family protein [Magnetococcus sp. MYC-9]
MVDALAQVIVERLCAAPESPAPAPPAGPTPPLAKVVSVCCYRDGGVWQRASREIVRRIAATSYEVLVPDHEVALFQAITAAPFAVVEESRYLGGRSLAWLEGQIPHGRGRPGWYLQQFLKIEAARRGRAEEVVLIWDADTIPLKPLHFTDRHGRLSYYMGDEHHLPYFQTIQKLLDLEKIVDFSFIAQCFPVRSGWANAFCAAIERRSGLHWIDAVLRNLDFEHFFGFSEYESLGTFLLHTHPEEMVFNTRHWQRMGKRLLGSLEALTEERIQALSAEYDYISFEWWDP